MSRMFDPLDLYENDSVSLGKEDNIVFQGNKLESLKLDTELLALDDIDVPITVLDLPLVTYAPKEVILGILRLLRPNIQVNFKKNSFTPDVNITIADDQIAAHCKEKGVDTFLQYALLDWYQKSWVNPRLNSLAKIVIKIPSLKDHISFKDQLLNYYTSILKKFDDDDEIIGETSQRISELCGRSALPSMYRNFTFNSLESTIKLYEPSLTNDNLGWKTWGSSLILSQNLINDIQNFPQNDKLRVLELGSGTGLVGISWSKKWQELYPEKNIEMYVTDLPEIVDNLSENVKMNNLQSFVKSYVLDWTNPQNFIDKYTNNKFDIILVADPIYSPDHPKWLINMIDKFLSEDGILHLQIPIRAKYVYERQYLVELLKLHNFKIIYEQFDNGDDDWGKVKYLYRKIVRDK